MTNSKIKKKTKLLLILLLIIITTTLPIYGGKLLNLLTVVESGSGDDFFVQRGTTTIASGNTSATITAGTDYTAPTAASKAFIRITNTQYTGAGRDSLGGAQNADDFMAYITNPENITTSVTFARAGNTDNTRISWEIVEYQGPTGGANEIIVRRQGSTTIGATSLTVDTPIINGVSNSSDIVVFITGTGNVDTGRGDINCALYTAEYVSASNVARFTRGEHGTDANSFSWAVVEFTGTNWNIQRVSHTYTAAGSTETETITSVNSLSKAFIHAQKTAGTNLSGQDEMGHEVWLSATNQVSFLLTTGSTTPSSQTSVAWIIENTQSTGEVMNVTRGQKTKAASGSEPGTISQSYGPITDLTIASLFVNAKTAGTGANFPIGVFAAILTSTSNIDFWYSDNGNTQEIRWEVVEWPTAPASNVTVSNYGSQIASLTPGTNNHVGGAFVIKENTSSRNVTGITITESGSVDAQNGLDNIKLFYDLDTSSPYNCASESYSGTETQFGSTDTDSFSAANGTAAFTGSVSISTTQTMCVYVVLDVLTGTANKTLEIEIANPSTAVTLSAGTVGPTGIVPIDGTTNLYSTPTWMSGWGYRTRLTIDPVKVVGSADFSNFPIMVKFTSANLKSTSNGGHVSQSNGNDIVFTADDGTTVLDYEKLSYDPATGSLVYYVKLGTLYTTDITSFFVYYGHGSTSSLDDPVNTWNTEYNAVWHLEESSGSRQDSTTNNNDLSDNNTVTSNTGQVGTAGEFTRANSEYLSITDASQTNLELSGNYSIVWWVYFTDDTLKQTFFTKFSGTGTGYTMGWNFPASIRILEQRHYIGGTATDARSNIVIEPTTASGTWYLFSILFDDTNNETIMCLNSVCDSPALSQTQTSTGNTADLRIGIDDALANAMGGRLDEVRILGAEKTTDWVKTIYNNESSPSTFYTLASEETQPANYTFTQNDFEFFVTANSVTLTDTWPSGSGADLAENAVLTQLPATNNPLKQGDKIRLQINLTVGTSNLPSASQAFKLQYSQANDCTTASSWTDVGAKGSGAIWRLFDEASIGDSTTQVNNISTSTSGAEGYYSEVNPSSTNPNSVNIGQNMEWDWPVENNGALTNSPYCFRMIKSNDSALDTYNSDSYPKIYTAPSTDNLLRHGNFFENNIERGFIN